MTIPTTDARHTARTRLIAVIAILLSLTALKLGRPVVMPLTVGLFIAMLAWPLQHALQRRLPRWLSLLLAMLAAIIVLAAVIGAIAWSAATVIEALDRNRDRIEALAARVADWAGQFGVAVPWGESGTGGGAEGGAGGEGNGAVTAIAERAGRMLFAGGGYLALALGFAALALAELDDARRKIRERFRQDVAERMLHIAGRVSHTFRRYVGVKSITSAITGAASGLFALAVGLDFALIWAFSAFLLEYVPTIGSILAVFPPSLWAFIQFDGFVKPLAVLGGFTALQLFLGNYVDPRIEGRFMAISPLMVLLSITFWAWMWGPAGALLGVPMTVGIAVVARHFDRSRWVWALITEPNGDDAEEDAEDGGDDARQGGGSASRVSSGSKPAARS